MFLSYFIGFLVSLGFFIAVDDQADPLFVVGMAAFWPLMIPIFIGARIGHYFKGK